MEILFNRQLRTSDTGLDCELVLHNGVQCRLLPNVLSRHSQHSEGSGQAAVKTELGLKSRFSQPAITNYHREWIMKGSKVWMLKFLAIFPSARWDLIKYFEFPALDLLQKLIIFCTEHPAAPKLFSNPLSNIDWTDNFNSDNICSGREGQLGSLAWKMFYFQFVHSKFCFDCTGMFILKRKTKRINFVFDSYICAMCTVQCAIEEILQ